MDFFSLFNLFNSFKGCSGLNCFISKSFKFTLGANLIISSYIRQNRINPLLYPWYGQPCTSYPSKLCKQNHNENDWFYPVILSGLWGPPMRITKLFWFSNSRAKVGLLFQVSKYSWFLSLKKQQNMNIIHYHITLFWRYIHSQWKTVYQAFITQT